MRKRWNRLGLALIVAAAPGIVEPVAAVAAAPVPLVIDRGPLSREGQSAEVAVVGDSLTVGAASRLDPRLAGYSLSLDARVGRTTDEAPDALLRTGASSADVVVIALGTNDRHNLARYPELVAASLAGVNPVAHLIWVLPHRFVAEMDQIRGTILAAVAARPRSTTVDDETVWDDPANRAPDQLHFTSAGYTARAEMMAAAVRRSLASVVGFAARPTGGSWSVTASGRITGLGGAPTAGDAASLPLNRPVVAMASTATGNGYWLVAADGGIFSYGDAGYHGSTGGMQLNRPVLAMAATTSGGGYWLLATDGGVFTFGDAGFHGSTADRAMPRPAIALTAAGGGYLTVGSDGSVYPFGGARSHGSLLGVPLNAPVVGIARVPGSDSYWLIGADGGVFTYGPDAGFFGSTGSLSPAPLVIGLAPHLDRPGYTVVGADGRLYAFP